MITFLLRNWRKRLKERGHKNSVEVIRKKKYEFKNVEEPRPEEEGDINYKSEEERSQSPGSQIIEILGKVLTR